MFLVAPALAHLIPEFWPETTLEVRLSTDPSILAGLAWGAPRPGHPEGTVGAHVAAMLRRIPPDDPDRAALRALAIVHDAAKMAVRRDDAWSPDNDHAVLARRLAEAHTDDPRLLAAIELHDEPYWRWRHDGSDASVDSVLERVADPALFVRFVELDASTEGKDLSFLWWFRRRTVDVLQVTAGDWSRAPLGGEYGRRGSARAAARGAQRPGLCSDLTGLGCRAARTSARTLERRTRLRVRAWPRKRQSRRAMSRASLVVLGGSVVSSRAC